jgi:hypothetical protein
MTASPSPVHAEWDPSPLEYSTVGIIAIYVIKLAADGALNAQR